MINAARIQGGQVLGEFIYRGAIGDLPIQKGPVSVVPVIEERKTPDDFYSVSGPTVTVEAAAVRKTWTLVERPIEEVRAAKLARLAAYRYGVEVGGVIVGGATVSTDDRSKTLLMGAKLKAQADPNYQVDWKTGPGTYATFGAAQIIAVAEAVESHVSACFTAEQVHAEAILAQVSAAAIIAYDSSTLWP